MKTEEKQVVRKKILTLLRNQKEEDKLNKSLVILEKLFASPSFKEARTVLFYASFDGEVETFKMMAQAKKTGKNIALPITLVQEQKIIPALIDNFETELEHGPYGIQQPRYDHNKIVNTPDIDAVIVPGVAFDRDRYRLGRGKGFYDRFLKSLPKNVNTIGLAYTFQIVNTFPHEEHDIPVHLVITN